MAQLTNKDKNLDSWLEEQYSDQYKGDFDLVKMPMNFTEPYVPMDKAADSKSPAANLEREVGKVFGILGHHIGKLDSIRGAKRPAQKKYRQLKSAILELVKDARAAGITIDICEEPTVVEDDSALVEEPVTEGIDHSDDDDDGGYLAYCLKAEKDGYYLNIYGEPCALSQSMRMTCDSFHKQKQQKTVELSKPASSTQLPPDDDDGWDL